MRQRDAAGPGALTRDDSRRAGDEEGGDDADDAIDTVEQRDALGVQGCQGIRGRGRQEEGGNENEGSGRQRSKNVRILTCPRGGHSFDDLTDRFSEVVVDHVGSAFTKRLEREGGSRTHTLGGQRLRLVQQTT